MSNSKVFAVTLLVWTLAFAVAFAVHTLGGVGADQATGITGGAFLVAGVVGCATR